MTDVQLAHRAAAAAATAAQATYTVRPGDSLSAIAGHLFGNPGKWPYLYDANRSRVGDNPDMIPVGMVLSAHLSSRASYGRARVGTAAAYHAVRHASSGGKVWGVTYGYPYTCGDGDGDGFDIPCSQLHRNSGGHSYRQSVAVASSPRRSYSGGGGSATYHGSGSMESCIIRAESGGNSQVMNSSGHYGLYQFSRGTWEANGGSSGSFGNASVSEQRRVFQNTVAHNGYRDWTPYDGC